MCEQRGLGQGDTLGVYKRKFGVPTVGKDSTASRPEELGQRSHHGVLFTTLVMVRMLCRNLTFAVTVIRPTPESNHVTPLFTILQQIPIVQTSELINKPLPDLTQGHGQPTDGQ